MSQTTQLPAETAVSNAKMQFMEIPEFKKLMKADKIEIIKNPNTDKLFASVSGTYFKVEKAIDWNLPVRFMYESLELIPSGCIVNVKSDNTVHIL